MEGNATSVFRFQKLDAGLLEATLRSPSLTTNRDGEALFINGEEVRIEGIAIGECMVTLLI
jgi:hypothetical protein